MHLNIPHHNLHIAVSIWPGLFVVEAQGMHHLMDTRAIVTHAGRKLQIDFLKQSTGWLKKKSKNSLIVSK